MIFQRFIDAVDWLEEQGFVDPLPMIIFGGVPMAAQPSYIGISITRGGMTVERMLRFSWMTANN